MTADRWLTWAMVRYCFSRKARPELSLPLAIPHPVEECSSAPGCPLSTHKDRWHSSARLRGRAVRGFSFGRKASFIRLFRSVILLLAADNSAVFSRFL